MTREEELKELKYREIKSVVDTGERNGIWKKCECPTCKRKLYAFCRSHYCPHCGQKLDWSIIDDFDRG